MLDLDAIDAALAAGARAVLLCNPHNPTGRVFTRAELTALAAIVDRHGARVVADEVHAPLVYPGHRTRPVRDGVGRGGRARDHRDVGVEGVQPRRPEVRAGRSRSNHADAARWRELRVFEVAGPTPIGIAASVAAYRRRSPVAAASWSRTSTATAALLDRAPGRRAARRRVPPARGDVPGVARLHRARPRRPGPLLPRPRATSR